MTPLRQRMIEDMRIRNFAATAQRSYIHYVAQFAQYFHRSPAELDLEAVRQYQLFLTQDRNLSPQSINTFRRPDLSRDCCERVESRMSRN
jgi:integrase/recombinase XerD